MFPDYRGNVGVSPFSHQPRPNFSSNLARNEPAQLSWFARSSTTPQMHTWPKSIQ
jgi:hypothetical protein